MKDYAHGIPSAFGKFKDLSATCSYELGSGNLIVFVLDLESSRQIFLPRQICTGVLGLGVNQCLSLNQL